MDRALRGIASQYMILQSITEVLRNSAVSQRYRRALTVSHPGVTLCPPSSALTVCLPGLACSQPVQGRPYPVHREMSVSRLLPSPNGGLRLLLCLSTVTTSAAAPRGQQRSVLGRDGGRDRASIYHL